MLELYEITDNSYHGYCWAKSVSDASEKYKNTHIYHEPIVNKVLTDQGYPIVRLRDVPKHGYFHRVTFKDDEFCEHSVVWCKDEYDQSTKKWCCYKFEDINHWKYFKGEEKVTVDFTF